MYTLAPEYIVRPQSSYFDIFQSYYCEKNQENMSKKWKHKYLWGKTFPAENRNPKKLLDQIV